MSRSALRQALFASGLWLADRAGKPAYVVIYDDTEHGGEDHAENYYGYFDSPDDAVRMFGEFAGARPERYVNVKLAMVIEDKPAADNADFPPPPLAQRPRDVLMMRLETSFGTAPQPSFDFSVPPDSAWQPERTRVFDPPWDFGVPGHRIPVLEPGERLKIGPDRVVAAIAVTDVEKARLALDHLCKARDLYRDIKAKRTLARVRHAISSAKGAVRNVGYRETRAQMERDAAAAPALSDASWLPEGCDAILSSFAEGSMSFEDARTDLCLLGMTDGGARVELIAKGEWLVEDAVWQAPDGERFRAVDGVLGTSFIYNSDTCPSKHWNDGNDVCADCGEDLQATDDSLDGKEG